MNQMKIHMIESAIDSYSEIYPCVGRESFDECFTVYDGKLHFWFNTADRTTHLLSERL